jgi:drug/metabolite transporter (DMT)-like permease
MKQLRAELALAGITVVWGTTFVLVKAALADVSTFVFLAMRFSLAALVLILIYGRALLNGARKSGVRIGPGLLAGTILFVAYVFQTTGLERTTASKSAFLTGLSIPMVPFVGSLVYKVWPRRIEVAGIFVASIGMVLMTMPAGSGLQMASGESLGDLLSLLCAVTFAVHIVVVGHYSQLEGFQSLAVVQIAVAALLGSASFWFAEPVKLHMTGGVATAVLVTGLLATALAFTTQAWAQQYTSATRAALIFSLEPPVAWLTSYLLTGERMASRGKVGAGLIVVGILAVELTKVTIPSAGTSD